MKTLYFECKMGAAGDMLMAALYEICDQKELFLQTMNQAFSEYGIQISAEESKKCGISGTTLSIFKEPKLSISILYIPAFKVNHYNGSVP